MSARLSGKFAVVFGAGSSGAALRQLLVILGYGGPTLTFSRSPFGDPRRDRPKLAGWCRSPATLDSTHQSRGNRLLVHRPVDAEVLSLLEFLETGAGALAAEPALLDASERSGRVGHDSTVDADHARVERLTEAHRALQLTGVRKRQAPSRRR